MAELKALLIDLIRLEIELWDAVDARLRQEADLQLRDFLLIQVIGSTDSCRVYTLVERSGITVGTASKGVDRLEKAGLCLRRDNPKDRRSPIIELTEQGRRTLAEASAVADKELNDRLASVLSEQELARLADMIAVLRAPRDAEVR